MLSAVTGFASAFAIVVAGLRAAGATQEQAASGLLLLCLGQGVLAITLSVKFRLPLSFAWSTPGAALLVASESSSGDFGAAVGAFAVCGLLITATGLLPGLANLVGRIPRSLSGALLAGILLPICLQPILALVDRPYLVGPVVLVWLLLLRPAPLLAVPGAMVATVVVVALSVSTAELAGATLGPNISLVPPRIEPLILVSMGVPLYIVTMAGQNVPGLAVLSTMGYARLPVRSLFIGTGVVTSLISVGGGHAVNLSAITAAMVAGPDAHPDRDRRWIASTAGGVTYLVIGLGAGFATALVDAAPDGLISAVAGLALLGALAAALQSALERPEHRLPAVATLTVAATGFVALGVGSAMWALLVGGMLMVWTVRRSPGQTNARPGQPTEEACPGSPDTDGVVIMPR